MAEVRALMTARLREQLSSDATLIFLARPAGGGQTAAPGLVVREATPLDAARYAADIGTDSPRTFIARLAPRSRCFVVQSGPTLVHATWLTTGQAWTRELRSYLRPPSGQAYVFESYTRPEVRGHGVYPLTLSEIARWAAEHVLERVWVAIENDNPSSLKAVTKAGFHPSGEIRFRRRFGRLSVEVSQELEDAGFEVVARNQKTRGRPDS